jgi:hypothetical protein
MADTGKEKQKKNFKTRIEENVYSREAADNLFFGVPELRGLLDVGLVSTSHGKNADYKFRTIQEVHAEKSHAFSGNVPPFGFKYAIPPMSSGARVDFQECWANVYHGPSKLGNILPVASTGLRCIPEGAANFSELRDGQSWSWCSGKIHVTPSVTVAWQAYSCQVTQLWRGKKQKWRIFFQCRADEAAAAKQSDTTSLNVARSATGKPAFNSEDAGSVDPCIPSDQLEWVYTDASRMHIHGIICMPFPWKHDPWHKFDGCMTTMAQDKNQVKLTLGKPQTGQLTKEDLQAAVQAESTRLNCGQVNVQHVDVSVKRPYAYLYFCSDLAASAFVSCVSPTLSVLVSPERVPEVLAVSVKLREKEAAAKS